MKYLNFLITAGTVSIGIETFYFPVPCRGIVKSMKTVFDTAPANNDTVDIQRASTSVNKVTTGATDTGKVYTGTPNTTNKDLIFDPESDTEANKMLRIVISQLVTKNTVIGITIEYDDSAAVVQAASEA